MLSEGSTIPDWLSAISNSVSAIAVIVGLAIAWRQLAAWKEQEKQKARSVTAEQIVLNALSIRDVMAAVRHPHSSIPIDQIKNKYFDFDRRMKLLQENVSYFSNLRLAQFKAQLLTFGMDVDTAIDEIFRARNDFQHAVMLLANYVDSRPESQEEKDFIRDARRAVYARGDDSDSIAIKLNKAISILETRLGPIIRLNE